MDEEKILIGAWLKGEFLEDLAEVEAKDFVYHKVVNLLQQGKNAIEIAKLAGIPIAELLEMTTVTSEMFYRQAIYSYRNSRLRLKLAEGVYSLNEIKQEITKIEGTFNVVKADTNYAEQYMNELNERNARKVAKWVKLPTLQSMTDGIKPKELTTVAARPSVGKSAFALQTAMGIAEQGRKVLYFPLEMSKGQTFDRILQTKGFTSKELKTGQIVNSDRYAAALEHIDQIEKCGLFRVYEGCSLIENIEAAIQTEKPFLVIVDQLTQMRAKGRFASIRERFSYMTSTLKAIAMRENVAIILLAQVNRSAQHSEPTMAELKESGSIEEDSDNIILLHPVDDGNHMLIKLAKQRSGETGDFTAIFNKERMTFYEQYYTNC